MAGVMTRKQARLLAHDAIAHHGALQDEWEFATLMKIVDEFRPQVMVEIGSHTGGSLWAWTSFVANVIAVTLGVADDFNSWGAELLIGDSTSSATKQSIIETLNGRRVDFVFIDGGHDEFTARADMETAIDLIGDGPGLIGLHDINLDIRFPQDNGPRIALAEYMGKYPHIQIANVPHEDPGTALFWVGDNG